VDEGRGGGRMGGRREVETGRRGNAGKEGGRGRARWAVVGGVSGIWKNGLAVFTAAVLVQYLG
jgi:hypothetical protein